MKYAFVISAGLGNQIEMIVPYLHIIKSYPHVDAVYCPEIKEYNPDTLKFWEIVAQYHGGTMRAMQHGFMPKWWKDYSGSFCCQGRQPWPGIPDLAHNLAPHRGNEVEHRNKIIPEGEAVKIMLEELPLNWNKYSPNKAEIFDAIICNGGTLNATWARKRYTRWNDVATLLKEKDLKVASVGLPHEFVQGTVDRTGIGPLDTMNLISRTRLFLANDSGLYHFASVIGIPTVVVFTATSSVKNHHPVFHRSAEVVEGWSHGGCPAPCQGAKDSWAFLPTWPNCRRFRCSAFEPLHIMNTRTVKNAIAK